MSSFIEKNTRNEILDITRGFCAYLVVLGHCFRNTAAAFGIAESGTSLPIVRIIYSFHMPFFMLLCGYFSAHSIQKGNTRGFLKKRAVQLLIPLAFWAAVQTVWSIVTDKIYRPGLLLHGFLFRFVSGY